MDMKLATKRIRSQTANTESFTVVGGIRMPDKIRNGNISTLLKVQNLNKMAAKEMVATHMG
jgi:hypothetical protein